MRTCEGSATQALDPTSCGSFDFARRLASLRMTLACEGSATQALDTTSCGSFDFARRLASLRMTLSLRRIRDPSARRDEVRILRLRSQARFAQDDTALRDSGRPGRGLTGVAKREVSYGPKSGP